MKGYIQMLEQYIPKQEALWFYQKMLSDPATMPYNANWDVRYREAVNAYKPFKNG